MDKDKCYIPTKKDIRTWEEKILDDLMDTDKAIKRIREECENENLHDAKIKKERIQDKIKELDILETIEGFEDAIIGYTYTTNGNQLIYSESKMIDIILNDKDMEITNECEAIHYISYGIKKFELYKAFIIMRDFEY